MACQTCRHQARILARSLRSTELSSSRTYIEAIPSRRRQFSSTTWRRSGEANGPPKADPMTLSPGLIAHTKKTLASNAKKLTPGIAGEYVIIKGMEDLYKVCAVPAKYTISGELRQKDLVQKTEEGEEIGIAEGPWLKAFDLLPTFSAWSQVTMLHMYLIIARLRCIERERSQNLQHQFIDNFFFDCERVMHLNHDITSAAMRQRYLKDIFVQWRGLIAAYDEGVVKGDAVLASAVWRNLFKARADVDFRQLAAIVAWMRATLRDLEVMDDSVFIMQSQNVFRRDVKAMFAGVDAIVPALAKGAGSQEVKGQEAKLATS